MGESTRSTISNKPKIIPIWVSFSPFFLASTGKNGAFFYFFKTIITTEVNVEKYFSFMQFSDKSLKLCECDYKKSKYIRF